MPKPDRELKEGKADKDQQNTEILFLPIATDCKGWPLSNEGHSI